MEEMKRRSKYNKKDVKGEEEAEGEWLYLILEDQKEME